MLKQLQKSLEKIAEFEIKHFYLVLTLVLLFTSFCAIGMTRLEFQSDLDKMNPQDLPVIKTSDKIESKFSSAEPIVVMIELSDCNGACTINDIRDPEVIKFISRLKENLAKESEVQGVYSAEMLFPFGVPDDKGQVIQTINAVPQASDFFNDAYTFTIVNIQTDLGSDEAKIREFNDRIQEIIELSSKPGGVDVVVTGTPPLMAVMFNLLIQDSFWTLVYASIFIFVLILLIQRSFSKSIITMAPLLFGLCWTIGIVGWLNIPVTIATAGMSAIILGLGVEYAVFLYSRYQEERLNLSVEDSIKKALSTTGASTLSSGLTTIIGFYVLSFSIFPVLADLGKVLAMGIAFAISSTIIILPLAIILRIKMLKRQPIEVVQKKSKIENYFSGYAGFVSRKPLIVLIIGFVITLIMFSGIQKIENQEIDFDTVLPDDLVEVTSFEKIMNEFGDTLSVKIYVEIANTEAGSNQPNDIRDPRVIEYVDVLSQKAKEISYAKDVSSISLAEKQVYRLIPGSLSEQKQVIDDYNLNSYFTEDYSATIIRVQLYPEASDVDAEIARQVTEIVETTQGIAGVDAIASGGLVVIYELNKIQNPDTAKTSLLAFAGIIILLLLLSRSIKYTILPLMTVVLGILWTLGFIGLFGVPFNSIVSSVITMTIGIGIDFGLQLSFRFRQELETQDKRKAMKETLKNTLYPMVITVVAAVIGFSTMRLGNLKLMSQLGTAMSFSILACMLVAVSMVASLIVLLERKR